MKKFKHLYNTTWDKKPVLICCSGGPDSVFLTHFIGHLSNLSNHHLIYINHHLRPIENQREIDIVENLSHQFHFKCHIESVAINKKHQSEYRHARLKKIITICKKNNLSTVLLAHHLNDDIESLILQLLKGATTNFRGIPQTTVMDGIEFVHPLLTLSKDTIFTYLKKNSVPYSIDSSNLTHDYDRNIIRHGLTHIVSSISAADRQAHHPLAMLKSLELAFIEKAQTLPYQKILGQTWLKKESLNKHPHHQHLILKAWIENTFNTYINYNNLEKLVMSLEKPTLTKIQCNAIPIAIDYKWIVIGHKHPVPLSITIEKNKVTHTDIGTVCCTQIPTNLTSTSKRLCIFQTMLTKLKVTTMDNCPLKIPSQKKRLREKSISPLEQTITPIFYADEEVLWIPNGYHNGSNGSIVMTTISKI
jgi:tRNA(Ile)-lysidine synthetase-like protein